MPPRAYDPEDPESRPDTREPVRALIHALGGRVRPAARELEIAHSTLLQSLNGKHVPPTLDTLAFYAKRIYFKHGIRLCFTVDPAGGITFEFIGHPHRAAG